MERRGGGGGGGRRSFVRVMRVAWRDCIACRIKRVLPHQTRYGVGWINHGIDT